VLRACPLTCLGGPLALLTMYVAIKFTHSTPRVRRRSIVTSPRSSISPHIALLIMLAGRYPSELTLAA
jgi:hypothetical protein